MLAVGSSATVVLHFTEQRVQTLTRKSTSPVADALDAQNNFTTALFFGVSWPENLQGAQSK